MILIIIFVLYLNYLRRELKKSEKAYDALFADCDAGDALVNWRLANPDIPVYKSTYARWLVMTRIKTYKSFLETHPYIKDNGFLDFLYSLLDPPPRPKKRKRVPKIPLRPCVSKAVYLSILLAKHYSFGIALVCHNFQHHFYYLNSARIRT